MNPALVGIGVATTKSRKQSRSIRDVVREETRLAYREAILVAAGRAFGRLGFHAAKMADIAAEAGVAAGTLYNYFKSKEEIFESILERAGDEFYGQFLAHINIEDPLARIDAFMRAAFQFMEERGGLFSLIFAGVGIVEWGEQRIHKRSTRNSEVHERIEQLTAEAVAAAVAAGQLRDDLSVDELTEMLRGLTDALVFAWYRRGCPPDLAARVDVLLDIFLNGARKP